MKESGDCFVNHLNGRPKVLSQESNSIIVAACDKRRKNNNVVALEKKGKSVPRKLFIKSRKKLNIASRYY